MLDELHSFSTDAFPQELRDSAWQNALSSLGLQSKISAKSNISLMGYIAFGVSQTGSVFTTLNASPQVFTARDQLLTRTDSVTAFVILEGSGQIEVGAETAPVSAGDIHLLDTSRKWKIELVSTFRAAIIRLEKANFISRLMHTGKTDICRIASASGIGNVAFEFIEAITQQLASLTPDDLEQMEGALDAIFVASLAHKEEVDDETSTSMQLSHLRRICRTIEARLSDPDLSAVEVAKSEQLSARYLQKLFASAGTTFGEYVKKRRLDRCRIDLANSSLKHLTISELCFRWGFNDAANFSRAFHVEYGVSPKAYRTQPRSASRKYELRGRPGPSSSTHAKNASVQDESLPRNARFAEVLIEAALLETALALTPKRSASVNATSEDEGVGTHYYVPASAKTVHWGYFSSLIKPILSVKSGDSLTIETVTQHAYDDYERMIEGDAGTESIFFWDKDKKAIDRRGAGPLDASIFGRGAGEGFGVHICTGPIYVQDAEPGDVLEIRILDVMPRPAANPKYLGQSFGSNAASWWGFHYHDLLTEPKPREVVTIYEILDADHGNCAKAVYNFRWTPQIDPFGVVHETIDYPGVPVDHDKIVKNYDVLKSVRIPVRPHFGVLAVAPAHADPIDSVPPSFFGGNLDNWRATKGARLYLPVAVEGALFSVGDPHASQGDSELCGTAIECSLTGKFQLVLHKKKDLEGGFFADLDYPFLETETEWVIQGLSYANHLVQLGPLAQSDVYKKTSLDLAMRDAFRKVRRYLMTAHKLTEDEAISLISVGVDFGVTQVVNGNWGVHAVVRKSMFPEVV
ncbi:MAG: acetamidase/formamidase family protein [Oxalicibacterium faecigallinarum]|uniref:acetamidase/formamidase family protein n=1 Tax=Oxalicibacterium faecigallinarum TaxID=573741 RepID=UPI00280996A9|nr:acetamidase/formamidase family protein [Oxalicibacterium faecigallinarum]MDQ7969108.1 acetamidase/formamidase family protein [Oxalicibacterium faecigallinarum]